ncbi:MAG: aminoacyl-tRNA hydrolase [Patescibacteria group bacterium]
MKIIVGLGNPGKEYDNTRHNIGFALVDLIAKDSDTDFELNKKLNSDIAKVHFAGKSVILAKPQTFVNKSGEAVKKLKLFYKAKPDSIVVIQDDLDIEFENFKLSFAKDSGGHRGVQSIIDNLKTNKFWRLRIGTANRKLKSARHQKTLKAKKESVGDFVLAKLTSVEQAEFKKVIKKALERLAESL